MKLVVVQGPESGSEYPLSDGKLVAGREESCAIRLPSHRVSRRHAVFFVRGRRCVVQDLGSANGIYINGHKMEMCELLDGTYIQLGDMLLMLALPPEPAPLEPVPQSFVEHDSGIDPDDPDGLPTMLAPASPELRALRAATMPALFNAAGARPLSREEEEAAEVTAPAVDEAAIEGILAEEPAVAVPPAPPPEALPPVPTLPADSAPQDTVAALRSSLGLEDLARKPADPHAGTAAPAVLPPPPAARPNTQRVEASLRRAATSAPPPAAPARRPWVFIALALLLLLLGALCGAILGLSWLVRTGQVQLSAVDAAQVPDMELPWNPRNDTEHRA